MAQETQSNITLKEEDKILKVRQGGVVIWGGRQNTLLQLWIYAM